MPLLVTALERAMQLAESMEARGFGGQMLAATTVERQRNQLILLAGLGALGAGVAGLGFWTDRPWLVGVLLAGGGALLIWSFWDQGRRVRRSRYQRWLWSRVDRIVLVISLIAAGIWILAMLTQADWLLYYPYPPYSPWPTFEPVLGFAILLLVAPALALPPR
jgi:energy-coupling factor transporter transmembrane protein EcfT